MGKQLFARKQGFKRLSKAETLSKRENVKRNRFADEEKFTPSSSHSDESGDLSEDHMDIASEEEEVEKVVYREPSMYENLLKTLGSRNETVANALRRRQIEEEGRSGTDEDLDGDIESSNESDEQHDGSGNDKKSPRSKASAKGLKESELVDGMELTEDVGTDDDGLSDTDEESDLRVNGQSISEASVITSTFANHLDYRLSKEEIDHLMSRKWSYSWKMPAFSMSKSYWRGTGVCPVEALDMDSHYGLKPRLYKHWLETYDTSKGSEFHKSKQRLFFSICNSYHDIMHHNKKPFYLKGQEEDSSIMDAYLMHSLNHLFQSKDLMTKNERKLAKTQEILEDKILKGSAYLDRGFTRPKVLILLPLAGIARRIIKRLIQLTPSKNKVDVENIGRFNDEFGSGSTEDKDGEDDSEKSKSRKSTKPPDFQALLGRDNNNDHFMIGIKFTKKSTRLYSDFYSSDIIVASPLGLITKIGEAEVEKEKDVDYLSSIEILIIDHADVMVMQNWSHVKTVVEHLNQIPSKQHGTDIMRVRPWYLDGQAHFYRQTIILSSHVNPDINTLFNQQCFNYQGKVKLECNYKGVLPKILLQARQIYERIDTKSIMEADDNRLEYFAKKVFPKIKDSVQPGVMIFVSSYFEFVRLRNFLKSQEASFCLFGEYIKQRDISRVRGQFFRGEKKIVLYTERAHFYYRYKIRGVQNLIIYSLPERKEFYPEIVNLLEDSDNMNCTVLFSRLDYFRLERIVGSAAAKRMVNSEKSVFVFA
ncbi:Digestive organ expansion factor [Forsythia ovata]|uniref:Digestive organ expansion factor n=1 Tax=Forsythia ovata TaxID=205694 RepID=A0ABD1SRD1_9LAMI